MAIEIGSRVRIKDNAYEGSDDPNDFLARGKTGTVAFSFGDGAWEVQGDDDEFYPLTEDEIEEIEDDQEATY